LRQQNDALAKLPADHPCRPDIDRIGSTVERSAALVRQLMIFSRSQPLAAAPLDLASVLREMTPILRLVLSEQITLDVRSAPDLCPVRADRGAVEQVVMNLVTNARDAIAAHDAPQCGDNICLDLENQQLDGHSAEVASLPPGPYVCLAVSDNGRGMPPDVLEHIFEPFFTTKEPGKGTGLGLATTFGIVQQHRGHITCASEVGHGTIFKVYLPCDDGRPQESAAAEASSVPPSSTTVPSATILLVEDEGNVREVVGRALQDAGYRVHSAAHAGEALKVATTIEEPIDLLVTDVVMPGVDGPTLAGRMITTHPDMPVIFISGYAPGTIELGRFSKMRFLSKPFDLTDLLDAVAELLKPRPN
jgi:two-component system cell cycle sensor histidine kinase/response regulator CckA